MKYLIKKLNNKKKLFFLNEKKKLKFRVFRDNRYINKYIRYLAQIHLNSFSYSSNITFQQRYCVLTRRSHSIFRKFKLSRLAFRELALSGNLIGIFKK
jgi:small subunit ribosomal protein S14